MSIKGVNLKSESFFSISPGVLELWRKNLRGGGFRPPPSPDRVKYFMVDIKKDDDLARHSPTLADPHRPSPTLTDPRSPLPTLAPSFNLAALSTLANLAYTLHLADSRKRWSWTFFVPLLVP